MGVSTSCVVHSMPFIPVGLRMASIPIATGAPYSDESDEPEDSTLKRSCPSAAFVFLSGSMLKFSEKGPGGKRSILGDRLALLIHFEALTLR